MFSESGCLPATISFYGAKCKRKPGQADAAGLGTKAPLALSRLYLASSEPVHDTTTRTYVHSPALLASDTARPASALITPNFPLKCDPPSHHTIFVPTAHLSVLCQHLVPTSCLPPSSIVQRSHAEATLKIICFSISPSLTVLGRCTQTQR